MLLNSGKWWRRHGLEVILSVAVVVLLIWRLWQTDWNGAGFLGKTLWDWSTLLIVPIILLIASFVFSITQLKREKDAEARQKEREKRWDFMKRVREVEATIKNAHVLLVANNSGKTWVEQLQHLMRLSIEVNMILWDIQVSEQLFKGQAAIETGLSNIKNCLDRINGERGEYAKAHAKVDEHATSKKNLAGITEKGKNLDEIIEASKGQAWEMVWTKGFKNKGDEYNTCINNLKDVMDAMRSDIYRSSS